ncbi:hypothetical protein [Bradyrhizobium prioriisuperbiae]|uniref:hypothetical protein n=1 Tax=Bradyrhizobium prioriisuperbiae TaxID=2854389 RepID=UPI0028EA2D5D|nr:hypothetical protein [Bradyrhizobium prioritasuperba]
MRGTWPVAAWGKVDRIFRSAELPPGVELPIGNLAAMYQRKGAAKRSAAFQIVFAPCTEAVSRTQRGSCNSKISEEA